MKTKKYLHEIDRDTIINLAPLLQGYVLTLSTPFSNLLSFNPGNLHTTTMPPSERIVAILKELLESSKEVRLDVFVATLKKILNDPGMFVCNIYNQVID